MDETTATRGGLVSNIIGWWKHPFRPQGTAFDWVLFVGFFIIVVFLWNLILIELSREVR